MRFKKLNRKDEETYERFKALYFGAFVKDERRSLLRLWATEKLGKIDVLILEDDSEFVGLLITAKKKDLVWVDYLAIDPKFRGQGYGSHALSALKDYYPDHRIFLEVETPLKDVDNYHQRIKRIEFYKENGFRSSGFRVNCYDVDYMILSYNGQINYREYQKINFSTYGIINFLISRIEKLELSPSFQASN